MGKTVGVFGMSGDGKTTSTIINPDGTIDLSKEGYKGMNPETHYIINVDMKELPFPAGMWGDEITPKNYLSTNNFDEIKSCLVALAGAPRIKSIAFDTLNIYLAYKEFNDRKKMTFDLN